MAGGGKNKKNKSEKDSGKRQYDRARGRGVYRRDPEEKREGEHVEGHYGAARDDNGPEAFEREKKKGADPREDDPEEERPKNTGRGAAGRFEGGKQKGKGN